MYLHLNELIRKGIAKIMIFLVWWVGAKLSIRKKQIDDICLIHPFIISMFQHFKWQVQMTFNIYRMNKRQASIKITNKIMFMIIAIHKSSRKANKVIFSSKSDEFPKFLFKRITAICGSKLFCNSLCCRICNYTC